MPVRDIYHDCVKKALIKEGWEITHDPYTLVFGQKDVFIGLGAEQILAAKKDHTKIAVEIKSFLGPSDIHDLEMAIGQYVFYRSLLKRFEPDRKLFLAVPESVLVSTLNEPIAQPIMEDLQLTLIVFHPNRRELSNG